MSHNCFHNIVEDSINKILIFSMLKMRVLIKNQIKMNVVLILNMILRKPSDLIVFVLIYVLFK